MLAEVLQNLKSVWLQGPPADTQGGTADKGTPRESNGALPTSPTASEAAQDYLHLPCAIIRGALTHLGLPCTVSADASALPACDFTINIRAS